MYECSRENAKPKQILKPKRVISNLGQNMNGNGNGSMMNAQNGKRNKKDEINVDSLDFTKKILHTSWHPRENIIAIAATNNLYVFHSKDSPQTIFNSGQTNGSSSVNSTSVMLQPNSPFSMNS